MARQARLALVAVVLCAQPVLADEAYSVWQRPFGLQAEPTRNGHPRPNDLTRHSTQQAIPVQSPISDATAPNGSRPTSHGVVLPRQWLDDDALYPGDNHSDGVALAAFEEWQDAPCPETPEKGPSGLAGLTGAFSPTVTINGVFQADAGFFHQDTTNRLTVGNAVDGADFRRARLSARGSVTETVNYFFQMDFAFFGRPTFTDVWLEQTDLPLLGNFRIGQWKQPFSLEVVSSFRYTTFMERSLLFQPFTPFRHIGVGFYDHSEDLSHTWAISGFRSGQDQFGNSASQSAGWGTAERLTWLAWYDELSGGKSYMHWGVGHFFATPQNRIINFRTIPEMFIGQHDAIPNGNQQPVPGNITGTPFFLQTGNLRVESFNVFGIEHLWVEGPFSWQTEVMLNVVDQTSGPTVTLTGFYTQIGYFLTGEHRPYDRKTATIDRVIPYANFCRADSGNVICGPGAWEIAFRVSYLDFHPVDNVAFLGAGGDLLDTTVGINWYWNPYTKLVANWVHSFLDNPLTGHSSADSFAFRAQIDF